MGMQVILFSSMNAHVHLKKACTINIMIELFIISLCIFTLIHALQLELASNS